ncbi:MAG: AAA domain-containing protein [Thermoanaerobaculia bacterium]
MQLKPSELAPELALEANHEDRLLAAWITLEVLSPRPLPSPSDLRDQHRQLVRWQDFPEPWLEPSFRQRGGETALYWFLGLAELDLAQSTRSLLHLFPEEQEEEREDVRGSTSLAVVVVDSNGYLVEGKTYLSSFAWGYGQVRAGNLSGLPGFLSAEQTLRSEIERRLARQGPDGEILPISCADVENLIPWLVSILNLPEEEVRLQPFAVRAPSRARNSRESPEPDLLNSFLLEDLLRVRRACKLGIRSKALQGYLSGKASRDLCDVTRDRALLQATMAPSRLPFASWPAPGRRSLALMQQAAVNHVMADLREGGLAGINGPPGTGKTTLIRDLVACVVAQRAAVLAEFEDPNDAFGHLASLRLGSGYLHLYRLDERLLGFEIVVASSNNRAVENISREIPAVKAVNLQLDPPPSYLASIADCVASPGPTHAIPDGSSWGLAAAVLGNAANRAAFAQAFWWHDTRSLGSYLKHLLDTWDLKEVGNESPPEVARLENAPSSEAEAKRRWLEARTHFTACLEEVRKLERALEEARVALENQPELARKFQRLTEQHLALQASTAASELSLREALAQLSRREESECKCELDRAAVMALKPGFLARFFSSGQWKAWSERLSVAQEKVAQARAESESCRAETDRQNKHHGTLALSVAQVKTELARLDASRKDAQAAIDRGNQLLGNELPNADFWLRPEPELQLSSPWLANEFKDARDRLFVAAFDLHRAFLDGAARKIRHNLSVAIALLKGRRLSEKQEPARRSLWATLFLVVPVISTTFASAGRLFGPLGEGQLGWLVVDEAGQAPPQAAVGLMWRCARAVVMGDPMQLEPVIATPIKLIMAAFDHVSVPADDWAAPFVSAQTLADRASWAGTELHLADRDLWIGSPLRVHRRCQEPMFSICNQVAYGHLMVKATPDRSSAIGDQIGSSCWIDVQETAEGKWSPAEGHVAVTMIERLFGGGLGRPDVFVITPFRTIAQRLREAVAGSPVVSSYLGSELWPWVNERVGTIHTFQGKEAEAVILVLGASADQSAGARRWAGARPNLLNVAVSRAQCRLYVIGNHSSWREAGYFRHLANRLEQRCPGDLA